MSLADKIVSYRKARGWSQEELADMIDVTRQSVSKWESGQSVPELDKIVMLSDLFGVSIDELLKEESTVSSLVEETDEEELEQEPMRIVTMEEAETFLEIQRKSVKWISLATALCIISPTALLFLGGLSVSGQSINGFQMSDEVAGGIGIVLLLIVIAIAVVIFIFCGMYSAPYAYLEKEVFDTEPGVTEMVKERQQQFLLQHHGFNAAGTVLCIIAAIPVIISGVLAEDNEVAVSLSVCLLLVLIAVAVACFIHANVYWESMKKLLQEGDYSRPKKQNRPFMEGVSGGYWCIVTAGYLAYSFITNDWERSWIVWPVAGVLFGAIAIVVESMRHHRR